MKISAFATIDPGVNGGVAILNDNGHLEVSRMPRDDAAIFDLLLNIQQAGIRKLAIESLVLFNGQNRPGASMAVYARNFGFLKGLSVALGFTLTLVTPQQWQNALNLSSKDVPKNKWKSHLAEEARILFPNVKITLQTADAALMAVALRTGTPKSLSVDGSFRCGTCFRLRPENQFYVGKSSQRCKDCSKLNSRRGWLPYNYGITIEEFSAMENSQRGKCAICEQEPPDRLHVDHNHETGSVRGLLCRKCNWGLGQFGDSVENLKRAQEYLLENKVAPTQ